MVVVYNGIVVENSTLANPEVLIAWVSDFMFILEILDLSTLFVVKVVNEVIEEIDYSD